MTQVFYKASKHKFDNDPEFKARAQQGVVRLQVNASFWMSTLGRLTCSHPSIVLSVGRGGEISRSMEKNL